MKASDHLKMNHKLRGRNAAEHKAGDHPAHWLAPRSKALWGSGSGTASTLQALQSTRAITLGGRRQPGHTLRPTPATFSLSFSRRVGVRRWMLGPFEQRLDHSNFTRHPELGIGKPIPEIWSGGVNIAV